MALNENFTEVFKRHIGALIQQVTGLSAVFYRRSFGAAYPRAVFSWTVWVESPDEMRGTLTVEVYGNAQEAQVDALGQKLLNQLDGATDRDPELWYYLHSGRLSGAESTDKTITSRTFTCEFMAAETGETNV